jgi:glycosyltransferase involved in cell wall biosynthesis
MTAAALPVMRGVRPRAVAMILAHDVAPMLETALRKIPRALVDDVYVMDNASTDGTADVARRLGLAVHRNGRDLGYGGNVREGLRRGVADYRADYVVEIHGDGAQFDPQAIAAAWPLMEQGVPFILGSRFVEPGRARQRGMPLVRVAANRGLSWIAGRVLRLPITEYHTGFRIYSRALIERLPLDANAGGHLFSFQIIAQAAYFSIAVGEVPVDADYGSAHTSISLPAAALYAARSLTCLGQYLLARSGLCHFGIFPRES